MLLRCRNSPAKHRRSLVTAGLGPEMEAKKKRGGAKSFVF